MVAEMQSTVTAALGHRRTGTRVRPRRIAHHARDALEQPAPPRGGQRRSRAASLKKALPTST